MCVFLVYVIYIYICIFTYGSDLLDFKALSAFRTCASCGTFMQAAHDRLLTQKRCPVADFCVAQSETLSA